MDRQNKIVIFLKTLREEIIAAFESFENEKRFQRSAWDYQQGRGGGEIALLRGSVFEKAAVNFSCISGDAFPMDDASGVFSAMGVSLITHMVNPHAPTVHFNIRYIETERDFWFAGGYDLTPMGTRCSEDIAHFHAVAQASLDPFGEQLYPQFSQNAKDYFYIPHRRKERGVGGIFFDHYNTGEYDKDFALWQRIGSCFLKAILPIYERRVSLPFLQNKKKSN